MANNLPIRNDDQTLLGQAATEEVPALSGIHIPRSKVALGDFGTDDGDVAAGNPMPVVLEQASAPGCSVHSASIAAGGQETFESDAVTDARLLRVTVSASAPFKAVLTDDGGVKAISIAELSWQWDTPSKNLVQSTSRFELEVTNLDVGPLATDFHVCFYWDET